jgi:hypothetical protein
MSYNSINHCIKIEGPAENEMRDTYLKIRNIIIEEQNINNLEATDNINIYYQQQDHPIDIHWNIF